MTEEELQLTEQLDESTVWIINQKDAEGLRNQSSIVEASNHPKKQAILAYIDFRLKRLMTATAIAEHGELKVGEC